MELTGATVGEVLGALTQPISGTAPAPLQRRRQAAQFRQRVSQRRRHPLSEQGSHAGEGWRHDFDRAQHRRRIGGGQRLRSRSTLSKDEILRYSRHLIMPEVGMEGQLKLKSAKVLLIGTGGLGAPLGLYLAAAGVGRIGAGGFRRGGFHQPAAAGDPRDEATWAARSWIRRPTRMHEINPFVQIDKHEVGALERERARHLARTTTSSSTARTIFRRATW